VAGVSRGGSELHGPFVGSPPVLRATPLPQDDNKTPSRFPWLRSGQALNRAFGLARNDNPLLRNEQFGTALRLGCRLLFLRTNQPSPVAEEVMENYADLMQRLLEIQNGERQNPKLIAEDERLLRTLQKRNLAGKPAQRLDLSEE
jgi:hypothetical protein